MENQNPAPNGIYSFRPSCKALIIEGGKLLTLRKADTNGTFNFLPGGGQRWGEPLLDALRRECREEVNAEHLEVLRLVFLRESYRIKDGITDGEYYHKLEYIFHCKVDGAELKNGPSPDLGQLGLEWIDIDTIEESDFYPGGLKPYIRRFAHGEDFRSIYLGVVD